MVYTVVVGTRGTIMVLAFEIIRDVLEFPLLTTQSLYWTPYWTPVCFLETSAY